MELKNRPRRLRTVPQLRKMVRETRVDPSSLVYPMFVMDGKDKADEIGAMPGQYRYTVDRSFAKVEELLGSGVSSIMLFGIPEHKDELGTQAYAEDGIIQRAVSQIKNRYPEMYVITDVCMCEYTSHGHCGVICECGGRYDVDNDRTLELLQRTAVSHALAGADMVAPSDMMDGRVAAIRGALDKDGFVNVPVMSYAVKYSSSFYGPFREAAGSAPSFGDRKSYQMDYHNRREGIREALLDAEEGADILMVKPALAYLDMIRDVYERTDIPVAAYSVSGEYAMVKAAADKGWIDEASVVCEMAVAAYRAGASVYETYFAQELAQYMKEGRIG